LSPNKEEATFSRSGSDLCPITAATLTLREVELSDGKITFKILDRGQKYTLNVCDDFGGCATKQIFEPRIKEVIILKRIIADIK